MYWIPKTSFNALVNFSELVSEANSPHDVVPLLANAALDTLKAGGAAVFVISEENSELKLVASRGLPPCFHDYRPEAGLIGKDLTNDLLKLCIGEFVHAHSFPLISNKDLFGTLVLFFKGTTAIGEGQIALTDALVHLASIALGKTDQYSQLEKAYSELQTSQEILARTEKLRALGQMSAGISHDLKNLLSPMVLYVQLLERSIDLEDRDMKIVKRLEGSLKRGIETTERLRNFSRQNPEENDAENVDLNMLVQEALEISGPKIKVGLSLKVELADGVLLAHLRSSDFVTSIINLLFNAADALDGHGEITLSTGESNNGVWVQVSDNGPGMTDEVKKKIFEPFFTTKGEEGTGLGLSMVYSFMQRDHGKITLDSTLGQGTTFTLWFPSIKPVQR